MGNMPKGKNRLKRICEEKHYEPGNVIWEKVIKNKDKKYKRRPDSLNKSITISFPKNILENISIRAQNLTFEKKLDVSVNDLIRHMVKNQLTNGKDLNI